MELEIATIRDNLDDALERVVSHGQRIVLQRSGRCVAAVISMDDLIFLEAAEDAEDAKAARKALAEMKQTGEKPLPWTEVKKEFGF